MKILVMRYRYIGDTLLTIPFLRALRQLQPQAEIHVLVTHGSGELLEPCPYVDQLLWWDEAKGISQRIRLLKQGRYDLAFVLKRSLSSAFYAWAAGIPKRIGFDTEGRRFLLTKAVAYDRQKYEADCFLDVLRHGTDWASADMNWDLTPEYWLTDAQRQWAAQLLAQQAADRGLAAPRHLLVHWTSTDARKMLPLAEVVARCDALLHQHPQTLLHAVGGPGDINYNVQVAKTLVAQNPAWQGRYISHGGQLSLIESMALISQMASATGVDSGPLHMARTVNVPTEAIFISPISPHAQKWQPPV